MRKRLELLSSLAFTIALAGCGQSPASTNSGREEPEAAATESVDVASQPAKIIFADETEYIAKMAADPTTSKKLGTSIGDIIEIKDYGVYSIDKSEWEKGGNLSLLNDYSLGNETRIECQLSAADGDRFVKDTSRRQVTLKGRIQSFSSALGLTISPCIATVK